MGRRLSASDSSSSTRTSVVLDNKLRAKLYMLTQAFNAEMGDIIRTSIEIFYEYAKRLTEGNEKVQKLLELAEDPDIFDTGVKLKDVQEFALKEIREGRLVEKKS